MKDTGIIRNIDDLGRIVIPKELRRSMNIAPLDPMEISMSGKNIVLTPCKTRCWGCGSDDETQLRQHKGVNICVECISEFFQKI